MQGVPELQVLRALQKGPEDVRGLQEEGPTAPEGPERDMSDPGFWSEENVLSNDECDRLLETLSDRSVKRGRAGARHLMSHRTAATLASSPRLLGLARRALGGRAVPYRATLFEKSGAANWLVTWHQDTALPLEVAFDAPGWGPWSRKAGITYAHAPGWALSRILALRIHLDASKSDNGPLKVVPGSHTAGVMTDEEVSALAKAQRQVECLVGRGGVLAMRPLLIHASSKAKSGEPRRVLHIEYAESLDLAPGIRLTLA
jgi:ectoine hydroxylase-related dioxygenase (phytanoyl-CoA dioxygenase family)